MISKILILSKYNNCLGQMAQGWLEFFDKDLTVISGAVDEKRDLMKEAVDVMKEVGIDLTDQKDEIPEEYLSDNWNYVIIINNCASVSEPLFTGIVKNRIYLYFENMQDIIDTAKFTLLDFQNARQDVRNQVFDFYMKDLCGKEMLGSDSCGIECDMPDF